MTPDEALLLLLAACRSQAADQNEFDKALEAIEALENFLSRRDRLMPDGKQVVTELVADGYCDED